MLAKRIIPCLDVKNGRVVKGVNFVNLRDAGDPVEQAAVYDSEGADELVLLDITASHEGRQTMLDVVRRTAETVFIPFTVGGGIRTVDDIRALLLAGADKVSMNTAAVQQPALISEGARRFGSQCIVVAIDARREPRKEGDHAIDARREPRKEGDHAIDARREPRQEGDHAIDARREPADGVHWRVFTHGGRSASALDAVTWARQAEELGAGEILLTSMDRDGTQAGYDIELTRAVAEAVGIPVIASGGAGTLDDFYQALVAGKADAALAASLFHDRRLAVKDVRDYLRRQGVVVR